ncbi:heavy metal transporter, partial [Streptomyces sp. T-3]|nr:heavy metal transporter [Streptomyces sp. T-3]
MPEQPPTLFRRGRIIRIAAALVVLLAVAGYLVVQYEGGGKRAPRCTVVSAAGDGATYEMSTQQAVNAATISAVGTSRGMPERAVTIALATALQESGLRNIRHGDRDSLGLFQQRPSQGWGTTEQIMDPVYAAEKFYEHLDKVPGYSRLPLTVAAQRVQRSGFPQAYAKHEPDASLLAAAMTGRAAATFTCEAGTAPDNEPGDPAKVREALTRDFGP